MKNNEPMNKHQAVPSDPIKPTTPIRDNDTNKEQGTDHDAEPVTQPE